MEDERESVKERLIFGFIVGGVVGKGTSATSAPVEAVIESSGTANNTGTTLDQLVTDVTGGTSTTGAVTTDTNTGTVVAVDATSGTAIVADADANGTFSLVEVQAAYAAATEEAFKAADTDASGELSAEELAAAVAANAFAG